MSAPRLTWLRETGLSAGQLSRQFARFERSASVHVVVHDWLPFAFEASRARFFRGSNAEPGRRYELDQTVGELIDVLRVRPAEMRVHVVSHRSLRPSAPIRRHSPRSVLGRAANGRIAEIHVDTWRYAIGQPEQEPLDIVIDLDAPSEATTTNDHVAETPKAIWTPGYGWSAEEAK